jgi:putative resolvase
MKLSTYARQIGVKYKTTYRWWKAGKLDAYQLDTGTVSVRDPLTVSATHVALYARVSSVDQKNDLERQLERLKDYAAAHGYQVTRMVSEIGSGLNDRRPKFLKLLTDPTIGVIVVEHRDRGTRFGFIYIEQL